MIQFIKNLPMKMVIGFYGFFREFGCIKVDGKYHFSTKKLWFQIAQIVFVGSVALKIFANNEIASRISDNLIGLLLGHASGAAMTYGLSKSGDIQREKASTQVSDPSTQSPVHQQETVIPEKVG